MSWLLMAKAKGEQPSDRLMLCKAEHQNNEYYLQNKCISVQLSSFVFNPQQLNRCTQHEMLEVTQPRVLNTNDNALAQCPVQPGYQIAIGPKSGSKPALFDGGFCC